MSFHTSWDRFQAVHEINDLLAEGGAFVDRIYHALFDAGPAPERRYPVREVGAEHIVDLAASCREAVLGIELGDADPHQLESLLPTPEAVILDLPACLHAVHTRVDQRGSTRSHPERDVSMQD